MTPLVLETHGHLGWRRAAGFGFARHLALQPLALDEIRRVAQGMPVMFRRVDECWQAVAVMGPIAEVNVYVARDGRWQAPYVPAALRVYPFCLDEAEQGLALWEGAAVVPVGSEGDEALGDQVTPFFDGGAYSEPLVKTQAFLHTLARGIASVHPTLAYLEERQLLSPWQVPDIDHPQPEHALEGLYQLDERAFNALSDADWLTLRRWQSLGWLYAHLDSPHHATRFKTLARRIVWPSRHAPQEVDPADEASNLVAAMAAELDGMR
ncbi:SapC family protein [Ectothiorhodospira sp. BSL-9]|uniref:SapC family protein n=1 Tax=Ectothiorhodospira sp. BSL-9 TaxID=1442136 RepID=UPI0007B5127F|nr:SapC family protein [Ectothiorhodospira sp. BSL-9]